MRNEENVCHIMIISFDRHFITSTQMVLPWHSKNDVR